MVHGLSPRLHAVMWTCSPVPCKKEWLYSLEIPCPRHCGMQHGCSGSVSLDDTILVEEIYKMAGQKED
jgi:hypothetical protein